jgi:hypothetical protein
MLRSGKLYQKYNKLIPVSIAVKISFFYSVSITMVFRLRGLWTPYVSLLLIYTASLLS